ncbi:hypothetical protein V1520DRAFT_284366 [Lipomyces starkeyi]|uniref:Gfo/Idh/MocA-like oxidoreductase N-terminal domain-containing protein n=1 Tax=Lipomyces starkeyi NRRL Y-11557 TaxID=675824 RepID=A0A1E3QAE2_LIPST|nr:hypothetical protein LIPSTDRAFT_49933 [Lipomyces starkeyi NRRL Y-11557]
MSTINIGFIGYGNSAKFFHLPYVLSNPELQVYAFLQRSPAPQDRAFVHPGTHCTVDFPKAKHYRTSEEFFADKNIELVIVCSKTDSHAEFAEKALKAGKHVVVEKPFTRSSEEADRLITLAKEKEKILTVYQSDRRWDGDFKTLQYLLEKDAFGTVTEAEIHYEFENPPWLPTLSATSYTPGSGFMFALGTHTIDQALVLFGRPRSVTGFLRALRNVESEIEDTFTIILQYDTALLVTIKTTIITPMQDQLKYFIRGTKGSFIKVINYGTDPQEDHAISGMPSTDPQFGIENERIHGLLTTYTEFDHQSQVYDPKSEKYTGRIPTVPGRIRGYYEHVVDAIRGRADLQVTSEESRDGIHIIELARKSQETGTTIPWS